jgi:hypothetical protein
MRLPWAGSAGRAYHETRPEGWAPAPNGLGCVPLRRALHDSIPAVQRPPHRLHLLSVLHAMGHLRHAQVRRLQELRQRPVGRVHDDRVPEPDRLCRRHRSGHCRHRTALRALCAPALAVLHLRAGGLLRALCGVGHRHRARVGVDARYPLRDHQSLPQLSRPSLHTLADQHRMVEIRGQLGLHLVGSRARLSAVPGRPAGHPRRPL